MYYNSLIPVILEMEKEIHQKVVEYSEQFDGIHARANFGMKVKAAKENDPEKVKKLHDDWEKGLAELSKLEQKEQNIIHARNFILQMNLHEKAKYLCQYMLTLDDKFFNTPLHYKKVMDSMRKSAEKYPELASLRFWFSDSQYYLQLNESACSLYRFPNELLLYITDGGFNEQKHFIKEQLKKHADEIIPEYTTEEIIRMAKIHHTQIEAYKKQIEDIKKQLSEYGNEEKLHLYGIDVPYYQAH